MVFCDCNELWTSCQKPMWQILKNLSKYFSQLEGPLTSKSRRESWSILSKLRDFTTRASTREPIAKLNRENAKNPDFWKFSKSFLWLGAWLARELWELLSKLATCLTWEAESPKQSCTVFEIFQNKNTFWKKIKILKNIFVFDQYMIKCNTFNQVQSHKWIRHSLNIGMCDACGYKKWDSPCLMWSFND